MNLTPGKYQTRNSRIVSIDGPPFQRDKRRPDGSMVTVQAWKGQLLKGDQRTIDQELEWEETGVPNCLASYVTVGKTEGISHEFDLVIKLAS